MKTAYFSHPVCRQHDMGDFHPESPRRLEAIDDELIRTGLADLLLHLEPPEASNAQLERIHPVSYISQIERLSPTFGRVSLDPDTSMNRYTLEAARRAAGAVVAATDGLLAGDFDNAFCAVRPPGHHAERNTAMGFCLFNNIACGAAHALEHHGLERVAVLDFDVHHGNGTEHIFAGEERVLVCSTFQYPFYPFTNLSRTAANVVAVPLHAGSGSREFREAVTHMWLPAVERFQPQIIFVSAGFDAHRDDPLAELNFVELDYTWVTQQIMSLAGRYASGRVVSTLEGGYDLRALARSVAAHIRVLCGAEEEVEA